MSNSSLYLGFDELQEELRKIAKDVSAEKREEALQAGGEIILAEAKRRAPVATGHLKNRGLSLNVRGDSAVIGWNSETEIHYKDSAGRARTDTYGRLLEMGSSKMAAQPHVRPAFEDKKEAALREMTKVLKLD